MAAIIESAVGFCECCTTMIDNDEGEQPKKCCKVLLTVISIAITMLDVGTDWYNYYEYSNYRVPPFDSSDDGTVLAVLIICILGTMFLVLELLVGYFLLRRAASGEEPTHQLVASFHCISLLTSTFEDLPMVAIFFIASLRPVCPVVAQLHSYPGFIAILASGLSAAWRVVYSCACCCSCNKCQQRKRCACCCCCGWCLRLMRAPIQILTIMFMVGTLTLNNPFTSNTDITSKNGPVYLSQRILTKYPSGGDFCSEIYVGSQVIEFANISSLGSEAKVLRVPCSHILPYYQGLFPSPHNDESQFLCNVVLVLFYNELNSEIRFDYGFEMRSVDFPNNCQPIGRFPQINKPDPGRPLTSATKEAICKGNATCVEHISPTPPTFDPVLYVSVKGELYDACQVGVSLIETEYNVTLGRLCEKQKPNVAVDASIEYFTCLESCRLRSNRFRSRSMLKACNLTQT